MKLLKFSACIFLLFAVYPGLRAQQQQPLQSINEGTINDQFEFVIKKSTNWNDPKGQSYEVINRNLLLTLKAHTIDSLNAIQARLDDTNNMVSTQQQEVNTLKAQLAKTQDAFASATKAKDSMVLLGAQMSKASYSSLMWSVIAALFVGLAIFIFKFKNSQMVTKAAKNRLSEVEDEFNEHRRKALEREQKIKRQLMDEINKHQG